MRRRRSRGAGLADREVAEGAVKVAELAQGAGEVALEVGAAGLGRVEARVAV
jgi:hypothetical protein